MLATLARAGSMLPVLGVDVTGHSRTEDENDPEIYGYLDPGTVHYDNLEAILTGNHHGILTTEEYSEDWAPMSDVMRNQYRGSSGL